MMEKKIMQYIADNQILADAHRIILGVSGGADSMALAYFMSHCYPDLTYTAAYVHHGLRPEADAEEALVKKFVQEQGMAFCCLHRDIAALAKERKQGVEETGREERYGFFRSLDGDLILTAHHKNDAAETVLLHLIRGCGLKGVTGIAPLENGIGRPFLSVTKEELYAYCRENDIPYAEDRSNQDTAYLRNKLRHQVLPLLETINPQAVDALYRFSVISAGDEEALSREAQRCFDSVSHQKDDGLYLDAKAVLALAPALSRRLLRLAGEKYGVSLAFEQTMAILELRNGKMLPLAAELSVFRENDSFVFVPKQERTKAFSPLILSLDREVSVKTEDYVITSYQSQREKNGDPREKGIFPVALFQSAPPVLRHRCAGDYLILPSGKHKKLSDYLIDAKIPARRRDELLLLGVEQRVLWILGQRLFACPGETNLVVKIKHREG